MLLIFNISIKPNLFKVPKMIIWCDIEHWQPLPGFIHQELVSCAGEVLNVSSRLAVDAIPHRLAHSQEVRPQAADGVLGYVSQGLTSGGTEHVAPHRFVDTRHVLGSLGLVLDAGHVNREALATDDLRKSTMKSRFLVRKCFVCFFNDF